MHTQWIDLTHRVGAGTLPYPGDPAPLFRQAAGIAADGCLVTQFSLASHTGTHVDAPAHVLSDGKAFCDFDLEDFCGTACLLDVRSAAGPVGERFLDGVCACDWLLICTGMSSRWGKEDYFTTGPVFEEAFVRRAAQLTRKGAGLDCAGWDRSGVALHRGWFESQGGLIVENLCALEKILCRRILEFAALPVKIDARDGAPVRAFVRVQAP